MLAKNLIYDIVVTKIWTPFFNINLLLKLNICLSLRNQMKVSIQE